MKSDKNWNKIINKRISGKESMLRQVFIILNDNIIYQRNYAKGLQENFFSNVYMKIKKVSLSKFGSDFGSFEFFEYKLSYVAEKDLNLVFLLLTGLGDDIEYIKPQLNKLKNGFLDIYSDNIQNANFALLSEVLDPMVDAIHKNLKPKISIIGFSGVGKTTTTKLMKSEEIPMTHTPTITGEVATIKIGKLQFFLWDFAGQDQFNFLWEKFILGSDAVLLITDSTLNNLEKSRYFFELVNKVVPYARLAVIANKQDLPDALNVQEIENLLGQKTYPFIAIHPENRVKMIRIIADVLEMDPDVSPLLKPLFERDRLMNEAQKALQQGTFDIAVELFEKISNTCLELGDDSLALDFQGKAQKLKTVLESRN